MPASLKFAWRWIVGATAAAIIGLVALPGVGQAQTLSICINNGNGRVRGIDVPCLATQTQMSWQTVGPTGATGPTGVTGNAGPAGPQGLAGLTGLGGPTGPMGPQGAQGVEGPTGPSGPSGIQGPNGIRGVLGLAGATGPTGVNGTNGTTESNKTFLTGGSLGTFGGDLALALSGTYLSPPVLAMGPGNGAVDGNLSNMVPMNDPGVAYNLFVRVDNHPGIDFITGAPITYTFGICQTLSCVTPVISTITDPDTTCNDLFDTTGDSLLFLQGTPMALFAKTDDALANTADVTWSVTYDKL